MGKKEDNSAAEIDLGAGKEGRIGEKEGTGFRDMEGVSE